MVLDQRETGAVQRGAFVMALVAVLALSGCEARTGPAALGIVERNGRMLVTHPSENARGAALVMGVLGVNEADASLSGTTCSCSVLPPV